MAGGTSKLLALAMVLEVPGQGCLFRVPFVAFWTIEHCGKDGQRGNNVSATKTAAVCPVPKNCLKMKQSRRRGNKKFRVGVPICVFALRLRELSLRTEANSIDSGLFIPET